MIGTLISKSILVVVVVVNDGDGDSIIKIFELIHPKPEILIVGLGKNQECYQLKIKIFSNLGIQLEITNSNNGLKYLIYWLLNVLM